MTLELALDTRPFIDRIIKSLGYKKKEAIEYIQGEKKCTEDIGALMPIQSFLIVSNIRGKFLSRSVDIKYLETWSDHYRSCEIPFVVVRESNMRMAIYKKRIVTEPSNIEWYQRQEALN